MYCSLGTYTKYTVYETKNAINKIFWIRPCRLGCIVSVKPRICRVMEVSLEYKALRRGASLLKDGVCPDDIVTPLYNNDLLTPDERSRANTSHHTASQRMEEVYSALERRVKVEPRAFHLLLDILKNVSALVPVAEKLHEFLNTEHSVSVPAGRPGT